MSQTVEMVVDSTPAIRNLDKITNSLKATATQYNQTQAIVEKANRKVAESSAAFQKATSAGLRYDASAKRWRTSTGQFATAAEKAAAGVNDLNKQLQVNNRLMSSSGKATADAVSRMRSLVLQVGAAYSAYKLLEKAVDAVNIGIQANQSWESQKLGIASVIGATNQLADAQGRVLQGSEKFAASQQVAEKLMERIQVLGLETVATTQDLVEGVQGIIAPATRVGIALEKVPDLAVNVAQAMGAMQIPLQQMRTEVEALLSGNINKAQDILATNLGITGEMVRNWQKQGVLLDEINKRLESFKLSGDALVNTWGGLTRTLKEYVEFISRGATEGLFNSLKSSAREFQSLLISINEQTGRPEVSNKVNNLVAAYERLNDVIGNKIYAATREFAYWLEELNKPENLAELEKQVSSLWDDFSGVASAAWEVAKVAGSIAKTALNGFNSLPQWAQEVGIIGGIFLGTRAKLAIAGIAYLVEISKNLDSSLRKLQNMGDNSSLIYQGYGNYFEEYEKAQQKIRESSRKTKNVLKGDIENVTEYMHSQLEERREKLSLQLEQEKEAYEKFYRVANFDLVDESARDYASQKAKEASEQIRIMETELDSVTSTLKNIYTEADSLDWYELMNPDPINDTAVAFAGLLTTSSLFGKSVMTAKDNVDALDGSSAVASIDFRINTNAGSLFSDAGQGTMFALPQWSETWKTILEKTRVDIEATGSTAGKTADKAKSKIESALHSVESELNKLQMTDAQYKQWQINEKVEKLEKLLGKTNPKVVELRNALQKELDENLFKDTLQYANPTAAAVSAVKKEYEDWKKNLEQLKKQAPDKYNKLIAQNTNLMADAQREYNNALEQAEATYINFRKETADIRAQATMSDDEYFVFQTNRQIEEWEKQGQTKADIDERINALLLQHNQKYTADFAAMWEETYNRVDEAGADMLENFLNGSKNTFDSLKKMFIRTLAEMANAAWLRPITVQIMGTLGGLLGVGGTALAYDSATGKMVNASAGGLLGNVPLSNLSSFLPDSFTSSLSGIMGATLPGTVSALTTPGAYTAGEILLMQGGGTTAGTVGGQAALMSDGLSLGSALMYGGLGSLGYSLLGGALGLPQNKYSGITSALGAGLGAWGASAALSGTTLGATLGSAVPVVGTVIGAALGGMASSLFGGGRKTHPSVYTKVEDASLFGSDWESLLTQGAWTDRASVSDAAEIFKGLGQVADTTANTILSFAQALPEEYAGEVINRLNAETVSFGRTVTAGRGDIQDWGPSTWNFQFHDEEQLQEVINTAGEDIQRVMLNALQRAMEGTDLSSILTLDLSSTEGLDKAIQAINAINTVTEATENIKNPLSDIEQQAKAAQAQLDEWTESMKSLGVNADYAKKIMDEYRHAYIDNVIDTLDESLHPLSTYAQAVKAANESVDQRKKALEIMGATEQQLARVEAMRTEVVKQATEALLKSFDQDVYTRVQTLLGNGDEASKLISQINELANITAQFGEGSEQYETIKRLQGAENAQESYNSLLEQMSDLESQRIKLQQEEISQLNTLISTWQGLENSFRDARLNLYTSTSNLDLFSRRSEAEKEFNQLYQATLEGDSEAASKLSSVGNTLLSLYKQTASGQADYLDAFYDMDQKLKDAQEYASTQVSVDQKHLDAIKEQIEESKEQSQTLEDIDAQIAALRPQLDSAFAALTTALESLGVTVQGNALSGIVSSSGAIYGSVKGYATGGSPLMHTPFLAGENGPELIIADGPTHVSTAEVTRRLLSEPAVGTDGDARTMALLQEQNRRLELQNIILEQLLQEAKNTRQNTADTADSIETIVRTGISTR